MKIFRKLFYAVFVMLFCSITIVNAASKCSYDEQAELNNAVANIKVSYEEFEQSTGVFSKQLDGSVIEEKLDAFKIFIYNLTDNVYVKITNDYNSEVKIITAANLESRVGTYIWTNIDKVTNFTFTVYSSDKTGCPNEVYRIINLVTPRYNPYSRLAECTDSEGFYLCKEYIMESREITMDEFEHEYNNYQKSIKEEEKKDSEITKENKFINFIEDNKIPIIIISTIIVIGGGVAIVIVIKKRRSRLI